MVAPDSVQHIISGNNHRTHILMVLLAPNADNLLREELRLETAAWRNKAGWALINADLTRQGDELQSCSDPARAWQALSCPNGHAEAYQPIVPSCKLPYCPICSHARSAEVAREYTPIVQDALNASPDTHRLRHIVLTTPYSINHSKILKLVSTIWEKALQCLEAALGIKRRNWKKNDIGVLGGWEFGGDGLKLHIHLLVLCPYVKHSRLVECWDAATAGVCQIVYIKKVDGVEKGVSEVTKYATKLSELPPQLVPQLHTILSGKRRVRSYGAFSCKLDQQESMPQTCPVCGELLVLSPLLNLRPGNNFAHTHAEKLVNVPNILAQPPPDTENLVIPGFERPDTFKFFN